MGVERVKYDWYTEKSTGKVPADPGAVPMTSSVFGKDVTFMKYTVQALCRRGAAVLCAVLLLLSGAACSEIGNLVSGVTATAGEYPVEVCGVTISAKPQRVVALSPSLADVVLALDCETQLAAVSDGCTQESLSSLPKLDAASSQAILEQTPDLVLCDSISDEVSSALSESGVTVLSISPATDREDYERLYSEVSSALSGGGPGYDQGVSTAQSIFTTLDDINRIVPKEKVTTACYLYDLNGSAVTGDSFASTIMSYAGVTNVFQSLEGGTYEFETLRVSNPTVIFCVPGLKSEILADSRFQSLNAVENDRVYELEPSYMEWQGRTVITAAYEISAATFPELLEENSMTVTDPTDEIDSMVSSMMENSQESEETYETLREGDQNEAVLKMQTRLDELGFLDTEYDGYYGSHTAECVKEFQKANGLDETGVADSETQRVLFSSGAKARD